MKEKNNKEIKKAIKDMKEGLKEVRKAALILGDELGKGLEQAGAILQKEIKKARDKYEE